MTDERMPIGALFDELAEEYEEVTEDVGWTPWPHVEAAFGEEPLAGRSVLDVGCGTGEVTAWLRGRGAEVTGLDASERMCELAAVRVPEARFIWHDLAQGLPFGSGTFDGVLALGCVEYVEDVEGACAELVRVTRPGGTVLYVVELCEEGLCGGEAREFVLYESWRRYRRTFAEVEAQARLLLAEVRVERVPAYVFDDTGEPVGYARVIGRARG